MQDVPDANNRLPFSARVIAVVAITLGVSTLGLLINDPVSLPVTNRFGWSRSISSLVPDAAKSIALIAAGILTLRRSGRARWLAVVTMMAVIMQMLWRLDALAYGRAMSPGMLPLFWAYWFLSTAIAACYALHIAALHRKRLLS